MLKDVVSVKPLDGRELFIRFEDGVEGVLDVSKIVEFKGVFAALKKRTEFLKVSVNGELGTIEWKCGADLDPLAIYSMISGKPIPKYAEKFTKRA